MSSDKGWILRKNAKEKFVLQVYLDSDEHYPPIDHPNVKKFKSIEKAVLWYQDRHHDSKHGLMVQTQTVTYPPHAHR